MQKNPFLTLAHNICDEILFIYENQHQDKNAHKLYQNIINKIHQFKKLCAKNNFPKEQREIGIYAIAAYVDEIILYSNWSEKAIWREKTLQSSLFSEQLAGEHFFDRLQKILREPGKNIDLLELYYVCLQLGFQGKYRVKNKKVLNQIKINLLEKIEAIRDSNTINNKEPEYPKNIKKYFSFFYIKWTTIILAVLIYFSFFISTYVNLNKELIKLKTYLLILSER